MTQNIIYDQLKRVIELTKESHKIITGIEEKQEFEREDFSEFKNRLGHLEQEFKSLKELVLKIPQYTQDKVTEAISPITNSTEDLIDAIEDKQLSAEQMIKMKTKKPFWKFW